MVPKKKQNYQNSQMSTVFRFESARLPDVSMWKVHIPQVWNVRYIAVSETKYAKGSQGIVVYHTNRRIDLPGIARVQRLLSAIGIGKEADIEVSVCVSLTECMTQLMQNMEVFRYQGTLPGTVFLRQMLLYDYRPLPDPIIGRARSRSQLGKQSGDADGPACKKRIEIGYSNLY